MPIINVSLAKAYENMVKQQQIQFKYYLKVVK